MTAPIQEPSTNRALQGIAYQRDQLLRRPAPVGAGESPSFFRAWLYRYDGSPIPSAISAVGITNVTVRYDYWENSNTDIFEPRAYSGFANPPVLGTDAVGSVRLYGRGLYEIQMAMVLGDQHHGYHLSWNDPEPIGWPDSPLGGGDTDPSAGVYENAGFLHTHVQKIYPTTDFEAAGGDPPLAEWPTDLGDGSTFVTGSVTAGSLNVSGSSDNEIIYALLNIVYTPIVVPAFEPFVT